MIPTVGVLRSPSELEGALVVAFPLRGERMAVHSPGSRVLGHGTDMLAQRYAFDLIRFDPDRSGRYHPAAGLRTLSAVGRRRLRTTRAPRQRVVRLGDRA